MKKNRRLFFLVIIFALIIHALLFLLILGSKFISKPKKIDKPTREITIERTPPAQQPAPPETLVQDLPNMLPGKLEQPANDLQQNSEAPTEQQKDSKPEESPEKSEPEIKTAAPEEKIVDLEDLAAKQDKTTPKVTKPDTPDKPKTAQKTTARKRASKPVFNFNQLNEYAQALGNSAFKNHGVDRPATEHDQAVLLYQEKVRKHFHENWNNYANTTYYYNLSHSQIFLAIVIDKNGYIIKNSSSHNSNNPALINLLTKILKYAEPFPVIPAHLKITNFDFKLTIHLSQGKFSSGYGYS